MQRKVLLLLICAALVMQDTGALPMPTLLVQAAEAILAGALAGTAVQATRSHISPIRQE